MISTVSFYKKVNKCGQRYNLAATESNAYSIYVTKFDYHNPWT